MGLVIGGVIVLAVLYFAFGRKEKEFPRWNRDADGGGGGGDTTGVVQQAQ